MHNPFPSDYTPDQCNNSNIVRITRRSGAQTQAHFTTPRAARYFADAMLPVPYVAAIEFVDPPPLELSEHETPVGQQQQHVQ